MKHNKKIILLSISILMVFTLLFFAFNKQRNVVIIDNASIAIMLETEPGVYTKSQSNNWPSDEEHVFDSEKSYCVNDSILIWSVDELTIQTKGSDKCYAYFKDVNNVSNEISKRILEFNGGKKSIEQKSHPFDEIADTNEGMYAMEDDYGTSYYFRGAVDNNWVLFADYYWRIVRINGDGSIRLIYSGTTAPTEEEKVIIPEDKASYMNCLNTCGNTYSYKRLNEKAACIDDCYTSKTSIGISNFNPAGYHGTNGEQLDFRAEYIGYKYTLNQHRGYNVDSYAKTYLDNWFENNLQNFDEYLSDSIFCNDRSFTAAGYTPVGDPPEGTSSGSDVLNRLRNVSPPNPILTCPHKDDRFTVNDTTLGNGRLDYKVGLLTADETAVAGSEFKTDNFNCYLHSLVPYWLMSPIDVSKGYMPMHYVMASASMHVGIDGSLSSQLVPDAAAFRPVISLNSDISVTGSGLWNDPYFVVGSTVGDTGHQPDTS